MDSKRIYEKGEENVSGEQVAEFWFDGGLAVVKAVPRQRTPKANPREQIALRR